MRRDFYKGYSINAFATLDDTTSTDWVPRAEIFWTEGPERKSQALKEEVRRFGNLREAEIFAIQMSKSWIKELFDAPTRGDH